MIKLSSNEDCCGCYACANICPQHCIAMEEDQEGFRYPITDERRCSDCGLCERVCPVINRFAKAEYKTNVFACQNMNEQIRAESSSGGVFTLLAEPILKQNGVVFGARFDNVFAVVHDFTETIEGLEVFRGSKYVQSLIGNNYKKAEQFLKQGREVLFTGTSCQIAGLKHFLRKEYKNLLTIDVVCHGVPSPKVFSLYLKELDNMQNGRLEKIQFRDKTEGWKKFSFVTKRKAGKNTVSYRETLDKNMFMRGFLQNLYLRPSCHACPSKAFTSGSDLTIADYWGIENIHPEFDDDKGCSLVLCNNEKGYQVFEEINQDVKFLETKYLDALVSNPVIERSSIPNNMREKFFELFEHKNLILLIKQLTKLSFQSRIKHHAISIVRKTKVMSIFRKAQKRLR